MTSVEPQAETIAFLSDPTSYSPQVDRVEVLTTHASMVFLAGAYAFKLKKAIKFSYLDYSTADLRHRACDAELALNRRTAPTLYVGLVPIFRRTDGSLSFTGPGQPVEWVVHMRRFPQEALFNRLAESGQLTTDLAMRTADRIAAFHDIAAVERDYGGVAGVDAVIKINDENLRRYPPSGVSSHSIDRLHQASTNALRKHAGLFDKRRDAGNVRRCHGDLHLGNICLVDGLPTLFDCIEFSELIACIDVLYDLAFLLMDLHHRGLTRQGSRVFNRYLDLAAQDDGLSAMPLFMSMRAAVRAHVVAASAAGQQQPEARAERLTEARSYFDLSEDLLRPCVPRLVAIGGLSGTGKSTVAAALAGDMGQAPGARVLRSDVLRKRLFCVAPEQRLPPEAYTEAISQQVYATLGNQAAVALKAGYSVIIDAVAARPSERTAIAKIAQDAQVMFTGIWLEATEEVLGDRLDKRVNDASDATLEVLRRQMHYDLGVLDWNRIDAAGPSDLVVEAARNCLERQPSWTS